MVINEECKKCQIKRNVDKYPDNVTKEEIKKYQYEVNEIIRNSDGLTTPQIAEKMDNLRRDMFGNLMDYTEIKKHYNQLMLECFPYMKNRVNLGINLYDIDKDYTYIMELLKRYHLHKLRISITVPDFTKNDNVNIIEYFKSKKQFILMEFSTRIV